VFHPLNSNKSNYFTNSFAYFAADDFWQSAADFSVHVVL
jgi:hypothetical protein